MSVRRAVLFSFVERYGAMFLKLLSIPILARLLSPEEVGIFSIGIAAIGMAHMLRDFGIPTFIIQEKVLTREKVSAAYGLAISVGWCLGIVVFLLAGVVGDFFEEPGIESMITVLAINFFIIPLGSMAPSLLKRNMCFGVIAKINLVSAVIGTCTTLSFVFNGYSYMGLVYGSVVGIIITAALSLFYMPKNYRVWPSFKGWKNIINISSYSMGVNFVQEIARASIEMMIGKMMGFATLGLYSRAAGYYRIYNDSFQRAVGNVIQSLLAKCNREDKGKKTSYDQAISYITVFAWPVLAVMAFLAFPIFRILFGEQWDGAITAGQFICIGGIFSAISMTNHKVLLGLGLVKTSFNITTIVQVTRVIAVFVLIPFGLNMIFAGLATLEILGAILTSRAVFRNLGGSFREFFQIVKKSIQITLFVIIGPMIVFFLPQVDPFESPLYILFGAVWALVAWIIGVVKTKHSLSGEVVALYKKIQLRYFSSRDRA